MKSQLTSFDMSSDVALDEKLAEGGGVPDCGYDEWARVKVVRGLTQARYRSTMLPIEQVLLDLSLDR